VVAVLTGAVLAMPVAVIEQPSASAVAAPYVPCPAATPPVAPPRAPTAPPAGPAHRVVGGEALATTGLAIPPGVRMPPKVTATAWLVADLASGAVLGACAPHERRTPASVQKLLLAATMLPRLEPSRVIEVVREDMDFEPGSSAVGLVPGGRYTVESLWLALLLRSGNDAANVLARVGGGTGDMRGGVEAMNAEARRLGAYQTHAVTPSGLDGPGQFTSAYDLALIARVCFARDDFRRYVATRVAQIGDRPGSGFQITNDNGLLGRYPGMLGGKTGFTDLARQTYVGVAERGGRRLAVTLLGAETAPLGSLGEASALLDWGFAMPRDAAVGHLVTPEEVAPTPDAEAPAPSAVRAAGRRLTASSVAVAGLLVGVAVLALFVVTALRRRIGRWRRRTGAGHDRQMSPQLGPECARVQQQIAGYVDLRGT